MTEKGITFTVRSTGHNPIPNVSSMNEFGVLIDLQDINSLSLQDDRTVQIGGGAKWGSVYTFLEAQGRSIIGARNLDVGVGGYTLGGGMPAFPNIHGLATDSVKNFEVVLWDSSVIDANSKTNSELWKGLKGGGTNFGIVTRFDIETYPLIKTKYAVNVYDPADYVNILKATIQLQESMEKDLRLIPRAFDPFLKLNSLIMEAVPWTDGTIMSLVNSIQYTEPPAATIKVYLDLYIKARELYIEANKKSVSDIFSTIQPLSTGAAQQGEAKGGNIMGIPKVAQNWWVGVEEVAESRGLKIEYDFMNDASPIQTVLDTYGPANLQLMKYVSARYDERKVFQTLQNGGYLLRNIKN
ncbi:6-hydroxy-D-nicotine oxidase [Xylaria venustula]|nr:6-hydroxy-D-nicotine oxidase [Xylaria venustula]